MAKRRSIIGIFDFRFSIFDWEKSLGAQGKKRIDAGSATGREIAGDESETAEQSVVAPSVKLTLPIGVPAEPLTVAVNVTD